MNNAKSQGRANCIKREFQILYKYYLYTRHSDNPLYIEWQTIDLAVHKVKVEICVNTIFKYHYCNHQAL